MAKVEASLGRVDRTLSDMKQDLRTLRGDAHLESRLLFAAIIAFALGLAGLMAKGFHWL